MMTMKRTYNELITLATHLERYEYLKLNAKPCDITFGLERRLNQLLYSSQRWHNIRQQILIRDNGCDMGLLDYPIIGKIYIHHINPLTLNDIKNDLPCVFEVTNLISVSHNTHNAIHYGDKNQLQTKVEERKSGDTKLW